MSARQDGRRPPMLTVINLAMVVAFLGTRERIPKRGQPGDVSSQANERFSAWQMQRSDILAFVANLW